MFLENQNSMNQNSKKKKKKKIVLTMMKPISILISKIATYPNREDIKI